MPKKHPRRYPHPKSVTIFQHYAKPTIRGSKYGNPAVGWAIWCEKQISIHRHLSEAQLEAAKHYDIVGWELVGRNRYAALPRPE